MRRFLTSIVLLALAACSGSPGAPPAAAPGLPEATAAGVRPNAANTEFFARDRKIMLKNGAAAGAFFIKGVDYSPTPICSGPLETSLSNDNRVIWSRDLPALRKLGVNAIKVYNAHPTADMSEFLNAAYNGGDHPIYV